METRIIYLYVLILALVPFTAADINLMQPINGAQYSSNNIEFWVSSDQVQSGDVDLYVNGENVYQTSFTEGDAISGKTLNFPNGNHTWYVKITGDQDTKVSKKQDFSIVKPKPNLVISFNDSNSQDNLSRINYFVQWPENGTISIKSNEDTVFEKKHFPNEEVDFTRGSILIDDINQNYSLTLESNGYSYSKKIDSRKISTTRMSLTPTLDQDRENYLIPLVTIFIIVIMSAGLWNYSNRSLIDNDQIEKLKREKE